MPEALKFTIGGDAGPFIREMQMMDRQAMTVIGKYRDLSQVISRPGPNPQSTVNTSTKQRDAAAEYVAFWQKAFNEREEAEVRSAVTAAGRSNRARALLRQRAETREQARQAELDGFTPTFGRAGTMGAGGLRGRSNFGAASSMFVSVARDSAASLASGAPITQVIAQQAPQVLQALTMMRAGFVAFAAIGVLAAVAAVGKLAHSFARLYFEVDRTSNLNNRLKEFNDLIQQRRVNLQRASILEQEAAVASFERRRSEIASAKEYADAETELIKAKRTLLLLSQSATSASTVELDIQRELLRIDLERARLKLLEAKETRGSREQEAAVTGNLRLNRLRLEAAQNEQTFKLKREAALAQNPTPAGYFTGQSDPAALTKQKTAVALVENEFLVEQTRIEAAIAEAIKDRDSAIGTAAQKSITDIRQAEAQIANAEAALGKADRKEDKIDEKEAEKLARAEAGRTKRDMSPDVTERQRMNLMAVGTSPLVDEARTTNKNLRIIIEKMGGGGSLNQHFGGGK